MKVKILFFWLFLSALFIPAKGQEWGFEAGAGLSSSRMDDLKYMHEYVLDQYPIPGEMIAAFPPYAIFSVGFRRELYPSLTVGAGYQFASTGSRSDYTDHSGSMSTNITTSCHRLGAYVLYGLVDTDWMSLSAFGRADFNYTLADISSTILVLGYSDGAFYQYRSMSPAVSAGAEYLVHLDIFSVGVEAAYLIDIRGELTERESGNAMTDPLDRDRVLNSDWTGWRAMLKVLIWL